MPRHPMEGVRGLVTQDVAEYRAVITSQIRDTDVCLEVGCAGGLTTARLAEVCRLAVGIDKNVEPVCKDKQAALALAARPEGRLRFETLDAFDIGALRQLEASVPGGRFDAIFVDLSGNRDLPTMTALLESYERNFGATCRLFCVKNYKLYKLLWNFHLPEAVGGARAAAAAAPTVPAVAAAGGAAGSSGSSSSSWLRRLSDSQAGMLSLGLGLGVCAGARYGGGGGSGGGGGGEAAAARGRTAALLGACVAVGALPLVWSRWQKSVREARCKARAKAEAAGAAGGSYTGPSLAEQAEQEGASAQAKLMALKVKLKAQLKEKDRTIKELRKKLMVAEGAAKDGSSGSAQRAAGAE
jgi:hypothetical protein